MDKVISSRSSALTKKRKKRKYVSQLEGKQFSETVYSDDRSESAPDVYVNKLPETFTPFYVILKMKLYFTFLYFTEEINNRV